MEAVVATGLARRFGDVRALDGLDLTVRKGELFGLVGPDAAGKTTAIRALAGLIVPDAGTIRIMGLDPIAGGRDVRERLGLMPQQYSLYGDLSIAENMRFFGRLFCIPRKEFKRRAERLLDITRLARFTDRRADALSGGMYKKLALSCALLHQPEVLLLDEPTNGVDPVSRRELWTLLYEFVGEGMAILVSTPYMDEAERCHRVALVHKGRALAAGTPRDLLAGFDHEVYEVRGDRVRAEELLSHLPEVHALMPSGGHLRAVVAPGGGPKLASALASIPGSAFEATSPRFEDLFLVRIGAQAS